MRKINQTHEYITYNRMDDIMQFSCNDEWIKYKNFLNEIQLKMRTNWIRKRIVEFVASFGKAYYLPMQSRKLIGTL